MTLLSMGSSPGRSVPNSCIGTVASCVGTSPSNYRRGDTACGARLATWERAPPHLLPSGALPNKRLKLAGALVLGETVVSCPGGHGSFVHVSCAGGPVARSLSAIR